MISCTCVLNKINSMKQNLLFAPFFLLLSIDALSQNIGSLDDYKVAQFPTNQAIVGAKWSSLGATTIGLPDSQKIYSTSLDNYTFSKENVQKFKISLISVLGLGVINSTDLTVHLSGIEFETVKDLYRIPMVEGEMVVYSAMKAKSIDLVYSKDLHGKIVAAIPTSYDMVEVDIEAGTKKKLTLKGGNLYIAHKIIKIDKITTDTKSKKITKEFKVNNIKGYDLSFNNTLLINEVKKRLIAEKGEDFYNTRKYLGGFIAQYANAAPITISIISSQNGDISTGLLQKNIEICYCKALGEVNGNLFNINVINTGDEITFDNIILNNYYINYDKMDGVDLVTNYRPNNNSNVTLISKTYHIKNVF